MKFKHLVAATIFATSLAVSFAVVPNKNIVQVEAIGNYSTDASTYYNGITATSGKQLAAQLHDLITSTHRYYSSYNDNGSNGYQKQTDQYYENGSKVNGYIYEFYSGVKWPNAWASDAGDTSGGYNREHCWCQSNSVTSSGTQMWGTTGGGADMHHLRPVESRLNSSRNNHPYGEVSNRDSKKTYAKYGTNQTYALGGYVDTSADIFEPLDSKKGDVARIILYTYLHYNSYTISTLFGSYGTTNGSGSSSYFATSLLSLTKTTSQSTEAKALEMLLSWNASDPVDDIERRRNEQVATYQGNRNPFIDNSNYAEMIWGTGGSSTPTVNSVSVSPSTLNLDLNGTKTGTLTATVNVSNGAATTVSWTSSNTNVATVSSSGVVTAVAKGSCSITATSTVNTNKSASCSVKVTDSSGGGGGGSTVEVTASTSISSYASANSWSNGVKYTSINLDSVATASVGIGGGNTGKYYTSGNEWRYYQTESATIVVSVPEDYTLVSVTFNYNVSNTGQLFDSSSSAVASGSTVSLTGTTATFSVGNSAEATNGQVKFTSISVTYSYQSSSTAALSSISLNTSNVQIEFYVDDVFDYSGLVVTAHYDNGTEDIVTPSSVSTPDMSTTGNKTVTVSYNENNVSKTASYTISVLASAVTEIFASVSKTYYVGETIVSSDITVEDDLGNEITGFSFSNNNYQFKYSDASSGGSLTDKTFTNSITYSTFTCSLTVQVQRKARVNTTTYSDTLTLSVTGISGTKYNSWSNKTLDSGATYAGQSAGGNDSIQLRSNNSNSGIVTTAYSGTLYISSITVSWHSGTDDARTLNIYGDTTAYTNPTELYSSPKGTLLGTINKGTGTSLTITGSYQYIGIRSASGALYLESVTITYGSGETPENVANYIMYEDTNNQCTTKFNTAKGYFEGLTTAQRNTFMSSDDYVISNARERLLAWAKHEGKTISQVNGDYSISQTANIANQLIKAKINNTTIIIIIISVISIASIGGYFLFRKKKEE